MNARTVLVLGGGVGGIVAANRARALLPASTRIILVDREPQHLFQPSLLWLLTDDRRAEQIQRPLARLRHKGIEVVTGEITRIDPAARSAYVGGRDFTGDALIVSLGAEFDDELIPGLAEAGHNLYSLSGASAARDALTRFRGGRVVLLTGAPAYKCPAAPYEAAMLVAAALRKRGVAARVDMYAAEPGPMGVAGPQVSAAVRQMVESKGIGYHPAHQVTGADAALRRLTFANGATADYDILIYVPPHRAPAVVRNAGLVNAGGWVPADRSTFATSFPGVYAIGDVTTVPLSIGKPLPKAGVFAHAQAEVVVRNLAAEWSGRSPSSAFDGHGACFVEIGDGRAGFGSGNFYGEPSPQIALRSPGRLWHWGKVWFEWRWLSKWF